MPRTLSPEQKKAKRQYDATWDAGNTRHYGIKLNSRTDEDIITALSAAPTVQGFIKSALRHYIAAGCPDVPPAE